MTTLLSTPSLFYFLCFMSTGFFIQVHSAGYIKQTHFRTLNECQNDSPFYTTRLEYHNGCNGLGVFAFCKNGFAFWMHGCSDKTKCVDCTSVLTKVETNVCWSTAEEDYAKVECEMSEEMTQMTERKVRKGVVSAATVKGGDGKGRGSNTSAVKANFAAVNFRRVVNSNDGNSTDEDFEAFSGIFMTLWTTILTTTLPIAILASAIGFNSAWRNTVLKLAESWNENSTRTLAWNVGCFGLETIFIIVKVILLIVFAATNNYLGVLLVLVIIVWMSLYASMLVNLLKFGEYCNGVESGKCCTKYHMLPENQDAVDVGGYFNSFFENLVDPIVIILQVTLNAFQINVNGLLWICVAIDIVLTILTFDNVFLSRFPDVAKALVMKVFFCKRYGEAVFDTLNKRTVTIVHTPLCFILTVGSCIAIPLYYTFVIISMFVHGLANDSSINVTVAIGSFVYLLAVAYVNMTITAKIYNRIVPLFGLGVGFCVLMLGTVDLAATGSGYSDPNGASTTTLFILLILVGFSVICCCCAAGICHGVSFYQAIFKERDSIISVCNKGVIKERKQNGQASTISELFHQKIGRASILAEKNDDKNALKENENESSTSPYRKV